MQDKNVINICLSSDNNYSKYAGVVIASILSNAKKDDELSIYILDGAISEERKNEILSLKEIKNCEINFIKINEEDFGDYKKIQTHKYITLSAYYRLKLPTLLSNIDKVIYLDCDTIVNSSLENFFNIDISNYALGAIKDINKKMLKKNSKYFNSGVLLINLDYWRKNNIEDKLLQFTKENIDNIKTGDQEVLNRVLNNEVKIIDDTWNVQSSNFTNRSSYINNPKIVHFVAKNKPWGLKSFSYHKNLYFKYLQKTTWKLDEIELKKALKSTMIEYIKYRPLFLFRPRFYEAMVKTYIKPLFKPKTPIIKDNTFIVWEPCSKSHSEVVPGYVKYLLDLDYEVSILVHPDRIKEGLFERFNNEKIYFNRMSKRQILNYLKDDDLNDAEGIIVTTVGKICDAKNYNLAYKIFNKNVDKSKILFVSHGARRAIDNNSWREKNITLRKLNYKNSKSVVVNPHYFGDINITQKNEITNFAMIGAIKPYKKNDNTIIDAILELDKQGINNFKITVIGKGHIKNIPEKIRKYFDFKGRLPFKKMYDELEKADFILSAYDTNNPKHIRYNTTGTSGNFQLVYGFLKPVILIKDFAPINGFDNFNSILYETNVDYSNALKKAIEMSKEDYKVMQNNLKIYRDELYRNSLNNLKEFINAK